MASMNRGLLAVVALVLSAPSLIGQQAPADFLLLNGKIFTSNSSQPFAEALAIRGDRIQAVGTAESVVAFAGPQTKRIDLGGRVVIPGINDAHYHFLPRPLAHQVAFDEQDPSWEVVKRKITTAVANTPKGTLINAVIGIAVLDDVDANRATLDRLAPSHPIQLTCFWGHCSIFNSAFMRKVGIPDKEPDPPGGFYTRDTGGRLTGRTIEYANFRLHATLQHMTPERVQLQDANRLFSEATRFGITSIQVMAIGSRDETAAIMRKAHSPIRIRVIDFPTFGPGERAEPPQFRDRNNVSINGVKWILDGDPIARTAAVREPYADSPNNHGREDFSEEQMERILRSALESDEPLLVHIVGDRTTEDFLKAMMATGGPAVWSRRRVRIEHGEGLLPDLVSKAKELGVIVVQNPTDFTLGKLFVTRYGREGAAQRQPFHSLLQAGIPIAIGSDGATTVPSSTAASFQPDTEINPYLNLMFAADDPFRPEESMTREQAIIAYTLTSAFAEFAEKDKGSLQRGKFADLAVLSQDIFQVKSEALPKTVSVLTMVGGKIVYDPKVLRVQGTSKSTDDSGNRK
jgi:predicted amidohydrolase YtcJ